MKKILIVGNWKMNLNVSQASLLMHRLQERIRIYRDVEVVVAPNSLLLHPMSQQIDRRKFRLAAQNAYHVDEGAFTGEVSFTMLRDIVHYCLVGHSERRIKFNESLEVVRDKVTAACRNGIVPILCVGETHQERLDSETKKVIHDQVTTAIHNLTSDQVETLVIAYEPVWAIGTGVVAKPDQIAEAIAEVRHAVAHSHGKKIATDMRVLYGASVSADTAYGLLTIPGVDGLLPGGSSLIYTQFAGIVEAANKVQRERGA
jgi:triosephosphate isomerase (TIM)